MHRVLRQLHPFETHLRELRKRLLLNMLLDSRSGVAEISHKLSCLSHGGGLLLAGTTVVVEGRHGLVEVVRLMALVGVGLFGD